MYLEGKAGKWFQGVKIEKPRLNWEEFGELLCRRFNDRTCKDIVEEFNKLQQVGSIDDYQERFEELKPLMMIKNRNLYENYFISSFISGLKKEIKPVVRLLKPATLSEAFELSQWQEQSIRIQNKSSKEHTESLGENRFGITRSTTTSIGTNSYKVPANNTFKHPKLRNSPGDTREPKKISLQEMQYRRNNGLCFKCGEKYGIGHQCKVGYSNCMTLEEKDNAAFEDAFGEQDEQTGNPGQAMDMSLHALSEALKRKTITLTGTLDGEKVLILVDTESSDSYISSELVIGMDISYQWVDQPFSVIMGNETCVTNNAICNSVHWRINQHNFRYNLKVMELGGWDIILGVDWMTHFSPITFDFQQLKISLHYEGDEIHLHGQADNCDMDLIRGKNLRTFIEYTRQMCMAMSSQQDQEGKLKPTPQEVEALLQEKRINSLFASPVLLVKKKEVTWRFCVDYRKLNEITVKDKFPIPNVGELLDELSRSVFKTKLDLTAGYHQIRMKSQDTFKITFQTHCVRFEFLVMPFGLTNAPATFQSLMNQVFQPYLRKFVLVFFDDILIYSHTLEDHVQHLKTVLELLRDHQLYVKRSKYAFAQKQVDYLGHTITDKRVSMDDSKAHSILQWPVPKSVKKLSEFLGLTGYYRRFIKQYGLLLFLSCQKKAFVIETDVSGGGIGVVLMQEGHPIAFLSKALSAKNLGLSVYEKELLALHKWMTKLMGLDYEIQYKKETENQVADALSRRLEGDPTLPLHSCLAITAVRPRWIEELQKSYETDTLCQDIIAQLSLNPKSHSDYTWVDGVL
ncbi:uncharacterized protein [Coffea arabica]|uniref:RNA-directed DNA polymerase n=1 Tax=Coffea arabica TaxID=13443 RepID=A0A6P6TRB6_COFAR|nr:uncharacterized protein LOC113703741 [Coffea arabica]